MTPVTRYIIYYGQEGEELSLSKVVEVAAGGGQVSECIVTGVTMGGAVRVGVAAVNSAGSTEVAYYPHTIGTYLIIMYVKVVYNYTTYIILGARSHSGAKFAPAK